MPSGGKKHSLSSLLWGSVYRSVGGENPPDYVQFADEKKYRQLRTDAAGAVFGMERILVLAKNPKDEAAPYTSYFTAYRRLYPLMDKSATPP
jgi:hypothetical protein